MEQFLPERLLSLEAEIINHWEQRYPETAETLLVHLGKKKRQNLYRACFRGFVDAALSGDEKELNDCAKMLASSQQNLPPEQAVCLLQLVLGFRNIIRLIVGRDQGNDFIASLGNCADRLVLLYGEHLSQQLGRQRARLIRKDRQLKRRNWELSALNRSSTCIISTLDVQKVLELILEQVAEIMFTDTCAIYELDQKKGQLRVIAQRGLPQSYTQKVVIPVGQGVVGKAVETRSPVVLENVKTAWTEEHAPSFIVPFLTEINFGAILAVPLICRDRTLGCIAVYRRKPYKFPRSEQSLLSIFADHAALAINNAWLYQKAEELAIINERNRIARELHDSVCQSLFSLVLSTEACRYLISGNNPKAIEVMDQLQEIAQEALAEMRSLIFELRPATLKEKGLIEALNNHITLFKKRHRIDVNFTCRGVKRLPDNIEFCLYRVAQEAMSNVVKHSGAHSIHLTLDFGPQDVTIVISDDGKGFDVTTALKEGKTLGIVAMRERVESCGGRLVINSSIGQGTTVQVNIPIGVIASGQN